MKKPIIYLSSKNAHFANYNMYAPEIGFEYNGTLFSGTIVDRDGWSYIEYTDGKEDGLNVQYDENGQLISESRMEHGEYLEGKEWYANGQLKLANDKHYDESGKVIRTGISWHYPNGNIINDSNGSGEHYIYAPNEQLAIKTIANFTGDYKNTTIYFNEVLSKWYWDIFTNYHPEVDEDAPVAAWTLIGWLQLTYQQHQPTGRAIIQKLVDHPTEEISELAQMQLELINDSHFNSKEYLTNLAYHAEWV